MDMDNEQELELLEDADEMDGKYLTFWTDNQLFGIPIADVVQIIGIQEITPIPDAPAYAKGVINLRGEIIPVVDVRKRFGRPEIPYTDHTCIIVTSLEDGWIGYIVDLVDEVTLIDDDHISPPPRVSRDNTMQYLSGIGRVNDRVVLLIDAEKILSGRDILRVNGIASGLLDDEEEEDIPAAPQPRKKAPRAEAVPQEETPAEETESEAEPQKEISAEETEPEAVPQEETPAEETEPEAVPQEEISAEETEPEAVPQEEAPAEETEAETVPQEEIPVEGTEPEAVPQEEAEPEAVPLEEISAEEAEPETVPQEETFTEGTEPQQEALAEETEPEAISQEEATAEETGPEAENQ